MKFPTGITTPRVGKSLFSFLSVWNVLAQSV